MKLAVERKTLIVFTLIFVGMIILGVISSRNHQTFTETSNLLEQNKEVLFESQQVSSICNDIQLATRSYILTEDTSFLAPLLISNKEISVNIDQLKELLKENPSQQDRITRLTKLLDKRISFSNEVINMVDTGSFTASLKLQKLSEGELLMNQVREVVSQIQQKEAKRLSDINNTVSTKAAAVYRTFYGFLALVILFVVGGYIVTEKHIQYRRKTERQIRRMNNELEKRVQEKTREVVETSKKYQYVLDNMIEGAQILDYNWNWLYVNDAAVNHLKIPREKLLGSPLAGVFPSMGSNGTFAKLQKSMNDRTVEYLEQEFIYPDGSKANFLMSIQPVTEGIFILTADISERYKREQQRQEHQMKLEEMLFLISHKLRHPVTNIVGVSHLFDAGITSEEDVLRMISYIKDSALQVDLMTKELNDFAYQMKTKTQD